MSCIFVKLQVRKDNWLLSVLNWFKFRTIIINKINELCSSEFSTYCLTKTLFDDWSYLECAFFNDVVYFLIYEPRGYEFFNNKYSLINSLRDKLINIAHFLFMFYGSLSFFNQWIFINNRKNHYLLIKRYPSKLAIKNKAR